MMESQSFFYIKIWCNACFLMSFCPKVFCPKIPEKASEISLSEAFLAKVFHPKVFDFNVGTRWPPMPIATLGSRLPKRQIAMDTSVSFVKAEDFSCLAYVLSGDKRCMLKIIASMW